MNEAKIRAPFGPQLGINKINNNLKKYFRIPADLRNINYDLHNKKNNISKYKKSYNSKNTQILNEKQLIKLLQKQKEISIEKSY